jgi:hypothetical protein
VPGDALDDAVDVLEELPREPALADPALARDRDEASPSFARGGVEEVLEQSQLGVAADERRIQPLRASAAAALGHDPQGAPRGHRRFLALEQLLARGLERDRPGGGPLRRLADEHGSGRRNGLEA